MDIEIDPLSAVPIYQQIRDRIVEAIGQGLLHRGDPLASVRQLAAAFSINPATVAKSYDQLRNEGFVGSNAKSGTFITADRTTSTPSPAFVDDFSARLFTLLSEGRAQGLDEDQLQALCKDTIAHLNKEQS